MDAPQHFIADLDRLNAQLVDAVVTEIDGFQWIDESRVDPAVVRTYQRLVQHGYANGWL